MSSFESDHASWGVSVRWRTHNGALHWLTLYHLNSTWWLTHAITGNTWTSKADNELQFTDVKDAHAAFCACMRALCTTPSL